jgi:membrane dipeptidase
MRSTSGSTSGSPASASRPLVPVFDGHNDTLLSLHSSERGKGRSFFTRSEVGHVDLPRARQGGLAGGIFAIYVPAPRGDSVPAGHNANVTFTENGYFMPLAEALDPAYATEYTDTLIHELFDLAAASGGEVQVVLDSDQLRRCLANGVLAAVLHFEGAEAIRPDLGNLEGYYRQGLRSIGMVWSRPNAFGTGVPFIYPSTPDVGPGLTASGKDLVRACNRLGIMVDLAHLNEKGFWDVAALSTAPLVVSHSAVHALTPKPRNLTDRQLDAVAASGGIVGITFTRYDVATSGILEGDVPLAETVHHMQYMVQRMGVDHVGFGSDFDGTQVPEEIGDVTGLPRVIDRLRDAGFSEAEVRKLAHENWERVLAATWR